MGTPIEVISHLVLEVFEDWLGWRMASYSTSIVQAFVQEPAKVEHINILIPGTSCDLAYQFRPFWHASPWFSKVSSSFDE